MSEASRPGAEAGEEPDEGYCSKALERLERSPRRRSPAGVIARGAATQALTGPGAADAADLKAHLALLEQRQLDLAQNLRDANRAFRRMAERLTRLEQHLGRSSQ